MTIMQAVYSTLHWQHALIARMALADAGIEFHVDNEILGQMDGGVPISPNPFVFQVRDQDRETATEVIREAIGRLR